MRPNLPPGAKTLARWAGVFYLLLIVVGAPAMVMLPRLITEGDAAATAANISANEHIIRIAFAGYLLSAAGYLVVLGIFYELLRAADRALAMIMVLFGSAGCVLSAGSMLFVNAMLVAGSTWHVAALGPIVSADLALLLSELYRGLFNIGMVFFGLQCIVTGWLFLQSGLIPRGLALLLIAGGLGYLSFLHPPVAKAAFPMTVLPGYTAELALTLWLLFRGIYAAAEDRAPPAPATAA